MGAENDQSGGLKKAVDLLAADSEAENMEIEDQDENGRASTEVALV